MVLIAVMIIGGFFFGFMMLVVGASVRWVGSGHDGLGRVLMVAGGSTFALAFLTWAWMAFVL